MVFFETPLAPPIKTNRQPSAPSDCADLVRWWEADQALNVEGSPNWVFTHSDSSTWGRPEQVRPHLNQSTGLRLGAINFGFRHANKHSWAEYQVSQWISETSP